MKKKISRRDAASQLLLLTGSAGMMGTALASGLTVTPTQVEGPFYPPEPHAETDIDLTLLDGHENMAKGEVILVRGRVTDVKGNPLAGVRVDIWQANHVGKYAHPRDPNEVELDPDFQGIGITHTDEDGSYGFKTIKPAAYPLNFLGGDGWRARHIHFKVEHEAYPALITQMYFAGDPLLEQDLEIKKVPEESQHLLITQKQTDPDSGLPLHRFDLVLG